jgi:hypothetical protein
MARSFALPGDNFLGALGRPHRREIRIRTKAYGDAFAFESWFNCGEKRGRARTLEAIWAERQMADVLKI